MAPFNGKLVISYASAGSGKTRWALQQVERHLAEGIPPERIAFVTFTKKGAEVAQLRVAEQTGIPLKRFPHFRTIHSMCFRGVKASRQMMMNRQRYIEFGDLAGYDMRLVGFNSGDMDIVDWDAIKDRDLVALEQLFRNNRPYYEESAADRIEAGRLVDFITSYVAYKKQYHYMDFTDLLERYKEQGLVEDVDVLVLDEAQDCTLLQWQVVFQAYSKAHTIYIVGDFRQSIFKYAGGAPDVFLRLRGEHQDLPRSYRVPAAIMGLANDITHQMETVVEDGISVHEGGVIDYITELDSLDTIQHDKTYFFLARNTRFLDKYIKWCQENGIAYKLKGVPYFSSSDKAEYGTPYMEQWPADKVAFAQRCVAANTFFNPPVVDISTIHSVKGDEADVVVLSPDMSKATASHYEFDRDSEHCVFYVGVTRAREKLYIMQPTQRRYYPYLF